MPIRLTIELVKEFVVVATLSFDSDGLMFITERDPGIELKFVNKGKQYQAKPSLPTSSCRYLC